MRYGTFAFVVTAGALLSASAPATECPPNVRSAVTKSRPGASITGCKQQRSDDGSAAFEVSVVDHGKKLQLDVAPDGTLVATEQSVATSALPAGAMKSIESKYPNARGFEATKLVEPGGSVSYEVEFVSEGRPTELTVSPDGRIIAEAEDEETSGDVDDDDDDDDSD